MACAFDHLACRARHGAGPWLALLHRSAARIGRHGERSGHQRGRHQGLGMALAGSAALAMWWDIASQVRSDFEHWHAHEHFPERLSIPGFLRASRWRSADGGDATFVLYELADHAVLESPSYLARLNAPSPWSTRLMPHHR